jgi:DNA-binding PadR family transcriptional regulator
MTLKPTTDLQSPRYWEMLIKKSVSRYLLLDMLAKRPMHGYEIASSIEDCCDAWCRPTAGMIYPTIKELVADGYIECDDTVVNGRVRKVCRLTGSGRAAYRTAAKVWASVLPYLGQSVAEAALESEDGQGDDSDGSVIALAQAL